MINKIGCFISIPKCASQSVLTIIEGSIRNFDSCNDENDFVIYEHHQRLCVVEDRHDLSKLYTFAFSRHPYSRMLSWYNFHLEANLRPYNSITFEEWVMGGCRTHWRTQNLTNWKRENKSPLLQYNFIESNKKKIDFIGKIENFKNDLKIVIKNLNLLCEENNLSYRFKYSAVKINCSKETNYQINDNVKERIYELFKKDFDFFLYDKD